MPKRSHKSFEAVYYNQDLYRFKLKTLGERNNALKLLERRGFRLQSGGGPEKLHVKLPKFAKYAQRF